MNGGLVFLHWEREGMEFGWTSHGIFMMWTSLSTCSTNGAMMSRSRRMSLEEPLIRLNMR